METKQTIPWNNITTGFILLVMVAGVALMLTFPIWLTPPNVASTVGVYLALLVLWVLLLIILAVFG